MGSLLTAHRRADAAEAETEELRRRVDELEAANARLSAAASLLDRLEGQGLAAAVAAVDHWCVLLAEAGHLHRQLPPQMARDIDRDGGRHELSRVAAFMATTSTEFRADIAHTLDRVLVNLRGLAGVAALAEPPVARLVPLVPRTAANARP